MTSFVAYPWKSKAFKCWSKSEFFVCFFQAKENKTVKVQADDPINFIQLINKADLGIGEVRGHSYYFLSSGFYTTTI